MKTISDYVILLITTLTLLLVLGSFQLPARANSQSLPSLENESNLKFGSLLNHEVSRQFQYALPWDISCPWHNGSPEQQERICYAWKISNHSKSFILTLKAECGLISEYCKSATEPSYGFCQIHAGYHPQIVRHPKFYNWKWQMDKCWSMYKGGVKMYGYNVRHKSLRHFKF